MIGYLQGVPLATEPDKVVLDVGGVGYEVHIPLSTYYELQHAGDGQRVGLHIHTHVREGLIALFGFWSDQEKALFQKLILVSGIGPRLAQTVLSGMSPADLVSALAAGDVKRLSTIPGIGKKTAARMVVELKDKVEALAGTTVTHRPATVESDLVAALVNLGYKGTEAERAVSRVTEAQDTDAPFADLLRASLKLLSKV